MSSGDKKTWPYTDPYGGSVAQPIGRRYAASGNPGGGTLSQYEAARMAVTPSLYRRVIPPEVATRGFVAAATMGEPQSSPPMANSGGPARLPAVPVHHNFYQHFQEPVNIDPTVHLNPHSSTVQFTTTAGGEVPFVEVPPARFRPAPSVPTSFIGMPASTAGTRIMPPNDGNSSGVTNSSVANASYSKAARSSPGANVSHGFTDSATIAANTASKDVSRPESPDEPRPLIKRNSASLDLVALASKHQGESDGRTSTDAATSTCGAKPKSATSSPRQSPVRATGENVLAVRTKENQRAVSVDAGNTQEETKRTTKGAEDLEQSTTGVIERDQTGGNRRHGAQNRSEGPVISPSDSPLEVRHSNTRRKTKTDTTWDRSPTKEETGSSATNSGAGTEYEFVPVHAYGPDEQDHAHEEDWLYIETKTQEPKAL